HGIFVACGALMGNTALAYLWGMDNLLYAIGHPSAENAVGLSFVIVFSAAFYFIFSWFKEQACVLLCPYARFQSVLVDERTATVAYDTARGEPRGRGIKGSRTGLGDCVDCTQCVLVCPTGIDIRNGSQLECIGCTRCIDACDDTMLARKLPTGLVRYASLAELQNKPGAGPRFRIPAYALLATLLLGTSVTLLLRRDQVGVDVLRRGSAPYSVLKEGTVGNTFNVHFRNRRSALHDLTLRVEATAVSGEMMRIRTNWDGRNFVVAGGQLLTLPLDVSLPTAAFTRGRLDARLVVSGEGLEETHPVTLAGPWGTAEGATHGSP
ncbi:MAG TPA: 4Fe-4S dicluster domain-containing protein, partial [Fibrobacteria bacterium]|nr:4Fe-4S dicluster domain-containing protein [Fibrobacteria bacterium]